MESMLLARLNEVGDDDKVTSRGEGKRNLLRFKNDFVSHPLYIHGCYEGVAFILARYRCL